MYRTPEGPGIHENGLVNRLYHLYHLYHLSQWLPRRCMTLNHWPLSGLYPAPPVNPVVPVWEFSMLSKSFWTPVDFGAPSVTVTSPVVDEMVVAETFSVAPSVPGKVVAVVL
jgi:hypothetical protein